MTLVGGRTRSGKRGCSLPWVDGWPCEDTTPRLAGCKPPREAPIRIHGSRFYPHRRRSAPLPRSRPFRFALSPVSTECEASSPPPPVFLTSSSSQLRCKYVSGYDSSQRISHFLEKSNPGSVQPRSHFASACFIILEFEDFSKIIGNGK